MTLTLTLVRHGESTDNLKSLWAGHRDAPLTTHGMNQARRLGKSLENEYISKIYASDLKRAHWTALQIATQNKSLLARLEEEPEHKNGNGHTGDVELPSSPSTRSSRPSSSLAKGKDTAETVEEEQDEQAIAETSAGPSSLASTDRAPASDSSYLDDHSCSSSAAASSPIPAPSSPSSSSGLSPSAARLPKTVTTTPFLREQFFGSAEGQNWRTGYATSSNSHHNRAYCFPQGESLEDVHRRAREIVQRCVVPWLVKSAQNMQEKKEHVVLVAHGIMISELLFALSKLQDPSAPYTRQSGHTNTGWTRMTLSFPSNFNQSSSLPSPTIPSLMSPDLPSPYEAASSTSSSSSSQNPIGSLPPITIRKTHTNHTHHLEGLKRTKGGVGSEQFDARQKSLRDFFSGGSTSDGSSEADMSDTPTIVKPIPKGSIVDLTQDDELNGDGKRSVRIKSPVSPSPKKGKLT